MHKLLLQVRDNRKVEAEAEKGMAVSAHRQIALFERILQELLSHKVLQRSQSQILNGVDVGSIARDLKHRRTKLHPTIPLKQQHV